MKVKYILALFVAVTSLSLSAQTQSWQWVKAGGSSSDNNGVQSAQCKIAGCDAYGNVYAVGWVNGPNMAFDTFSSAGCYSLTGAGISYLLFSYDCAGNMRWAKQIGDQEGDPWRFGAVTDPQGNTYFAGQLWYGLNGGSVSLFLGDTVLAPANVPTQPYLCIIKYDSLGNLTWFKNLEEDTGYTIHTGQSVPVGLRLGSSGNLWMLSYIDSNYAISPNLHTTLKGIYNVEVSPDSGNILGGYYTSNNFFGENYYFIDNYWDMDENENFYETGTMLGGQGTLILSNLSITSNGGSIVYAFSLDKQGDCRFIDTNKSYSNNGNFSACKYDYSTHSLVICWTLDSGFIIGADTFNFNYNNTGGATAGLLTIETNGKILWGKYITQTSNAYAFMFSYTPTALYTDHTVNTGLFIYNNSDTLYNGHGNGSDFQKMISQVDPNGNLIATHTANEGALGNMSGSNQANSGAIDWRGNVYLGGTVTNYFAIPGDSVVNTDMQSGNFFIAKLGISDCSCPTPGVQFTQVQTHGDTVYFYGSSLNHRDSIHWRLGDGSVFSGDTFFHVYSVLDTYTVTAIAYSGCGVDSITKQVIVTNVGIKTIEPDKTNLYPNPVTNSVNLEVSGPATIGLVYANGASVWNSPVQVSQQGTYVFDMSKYACALYYFIAKYCDGKVDVLQVVKE